MKSSKHQGIAAALALMAVMGLGGCGSSPKSGDALPHRLSVKMKSRTTDSRHTLLEVTPNGELSFAGGRNALINAPSPVAKLTALQGEQLWGLIEQHKLLTAKSGAKGQMKKVTYEWSIHSDAGDRSMTTVDDEVAGIRELHDYLFSIQANARYDLPLIQGQQVPEEPDRTLKNW